MFNIEDIKKEVSNHHVTIFQEKKEESYMKGILAIESNEGYIKLGEVKVMSTQRLYNSLKSLEGVKKVWFEIIQK